MAEKTVLELTGVEILKKHKELFDELKLHRPLYFAYGEKEYIEIMLTDLNNHSEVFIYKLKK